MGERVPKYAQVVAGLGLMFCLATEASILVGRSGKNDLYSVAAPNVRTGLYDIVLASASNPYRAINLIPGTMSYAWVNDDEIIYHTYVKNSQNRQQLMLYKQNLSGVKMPLINTGYVSTFQMVREGKYKGKILITGGGFDETNKKSTTYIIDKNKLNTNTDIVSGKVDLGGEFNDLLGVTASPDGNFLLIQDYDDVIKGSRLYLKKIGDNSKAFEILPSMSNADTLVFPSFSPDGKKLAFVYYEQGGILGQHLLIMDVNTKALINPEVKVASFSWSPDGRQIAYEYGDQISTIDTYSKEKIKLASDPNFSLKSPLWAADGKIYYNAVNRDIQFLQRMNPDGSNKERIQVISNDLTGGFSPQKPRFITAK